MYARFALAFSAPVAALITAATSLAYAGSLTWEVLPLTANGGLPIATVAIDTDSVSSGPTHSPRTAAFCTWDWYVAESSAGRQLAVPMPANTCRAIRSRSSAHAAAWRTRTSVNGSTVTLTPTYQSV